MIVLGRTAVVGTDNDGKRLYSLCRVFPKYRAVYNRFHSTDYQDFVSLEAAFHFLNLGEDNGDLGALAVIEYRTHTVHVPHNYVIDVSDADYYRMIWDLVLQAAPYCESYEMKKSQLFS